jgi:hypothetical protein
MRIIDIVMIVLFVVVLTMIVGLNIVSLIDKKLGNIEVIVPPVKPTLIVKIDKSDLDGYQVSANGEKMKKDKDGNHIVENFASISKPEENLNNKAKYEIKTGDSPVSLTTMVKENERESEKESKPKIHNPDDSRVVEYGNYICFKKDHNNQTNVIKQEQKKQVNQEQETKPEKQVCHNESLNKKFTYGTQPLDPFPIGNQESWDDIDPSKYYKKYKPIPIPIEDKLIKGYNIGEFVTSGGIYDVGRINLDNRTQKYAQPNNYILN